MEQVKNYNRYFFMCYSFSCVVFPVQLLIFLHFFQSFLFFFFKEKESKQEILALIFYPKHVDVQFVTGQITLVTLCVNFHWAQMQSGRIIKVL